MKISHHWLQSYFDATLPPANEIAKLLTTYVFEVEGVESVPGDEVLDVKVLPNRAHDCLSHRGIAREISVLTDATLKKEAYIESLSSKGGKLDVTIAKNTLCARSTSAIMRGIKVGPSPQWLVDRLQAVGQKSINNIVDATNYAMLSFGQPLHAFDLGKLIEKNGGYNILIRNAKEGERVVTLDDKEYTLSPDMICITDGNCKDNKILDIAGIKGGKHAKINPDTMDLLIEAANFDSVSIGKTSRSLGLRTDASMRFEHGITPEFTMPALQIVCELISTIAGGTIETFVDVYPSPQKQRVINLSLSQPEIVLGFPIKEEKIFEILSGIGCGIEKNGNALSVAVPFERLDLALPQDLIEEIGRIYGYENLPMVEMEKTTPVEHDANAQYLDAIRTFLVDRGFSEVFTSSFSDHGERELENPLASDKKFMRENLADNLRDKLAINLHNAPLLGLGDCVKMFEVGNVFGKGSEELHLAISVASDQSKTSSKKSNTKNLEFIESLSSQLKERFTLQQIKSADPFIAEFSVPSKVPEYEPVKMGSKENAKYKKISPYPFVLRDVAVFVPSNISAEDVEKIIIPNAAGFLVRISLFDTFVKKDEDKTSYAFNLVFQSQEKTLSEHEINEIMKNITDALNSQKDWKVR